MKLTPFEVCLAIDKKFKDSCIVAKVKQLNPENVSQLVDPDEDADEKHVQEADEDLEKGFVQWDMGRPLEADCIIKFLTWEDPESQTVFWHSSSHILGYGIEKSLGSKLCIGPPIERGFYYDA